MVRCMNKALNAIVVCGPSGVGKGTLLKRLLSDYPHRFAYSVSHTTRDPRPGEQDGREYHFVTREQIQKMNDNNEFLELCDVHGNFYGTSIAAVRAVQEEGKTCIIEIDVKGAQKLRQRSDSQLNMAFIFITAPVEEIHRRIVGRGADDSEAIKRRLATAQNEYSFLQANPQFFSAVVVNDVLDVAYRRLLNAINAEFERHAMPALEHIVA